MKELTEMSGEELKQLQNKITVLLYYQNVGNKPDVEYFYRAVKFVLETRGIDLPPYGVVSKKLKYIHKRLVEAHEFLNNWLTKHIKTVPTKVEKNRLYLIFAEILSDSISKRGHTVSLKYLLWIYKDFPAILDVAFPGYVQSGLLKMLLTAERQTVTDEYNDK